jgi:NAD dependent epimerase/dehydratase family enzyme
MKIAITGGSGFIGTEITKKLIELDHKVVIISKEKPVFSNVEFIRLDLKNEIENKDIFKNIDAVINLTGVNIFGRWNKKLKKEILKLLIILTTTLKFLSLPLH